MRKSTVKSSQERVRSTRNRAIVRGRSLQSGSDCVWISSLRDRYRALRVQAQTHLRVLLKVWYFTVNMGTVESRRRDVRAVQSTLDAAGSRADTLRQVWSEYPT